MDNPRDLEDRLIDFAVRIINVIDALPNTKVGNHIGARNCCVPALRQHRTTAKLRARNLGKTLFTR